MTMKFPSDKPKPTHYTTKEGGHWNTWLPDNRNHPTAHSIKFEDGSIFDMVNGWRKENSLADLVAEAVNAYNNLSPAMKRWQDNEQRRSFVRGQCPPNRELVEWDRLVDLLIPPMEKPND